MADKSRLARDILRSLGGHQALARLGITASSSSSKTSTPSFAVIKGKEKAVADPSVDQSVSVPVENPLAPSVSPQDSEQSAIKEVVPEEPVTESRDSEETADEVFTEVEAYPEIKTPGAIQLEVEAQDEEMRFAEIPPSSQDLEPPVASTSAQGTGLVSEIPLGNLLPICAIM